MIVKTEAKSNEKLFYKIIFAVCEISNKFIKVI